MGKRARLQRLPAFRAPLTPAEQRRQRPGPAPAPHRPGGWQSDACDEELDAHDPADWQGSCGENHDGSDDEPPADNGLAPCGEIEQLVHDWTFWSQAALRPQWSRQLAHVLPPRALGELRERLAPGLPALDPEVSEFARQHGLDARAPVTTLAGLALRARCRRDERPVAPVADWWPLQTDLLALLARAPDQAASNEVGVLAFHEAVEHGPAKLVRALTLAEWHEGWHPLAPWLLPRDEQSETLRRAQGSWLALRQQREAQRNPPRLVLPPSARWSWWPYEEKVRRLLRSGGASLRPFDYPVFALTLGAPAEAAHHESPGASVGPQHDDASVPRVVDPAGPGPAGAVVLTCRPLDRLELAQSDEIAPGWSHPEVLLQALEPHDVHYGWFDEQGHRLPGHLTVFEAWSTTAGRDPEPALCLDTIEDPTGLLAGVQPDLLALLEGVARSRGLLAGLVLVTGTTWGPARSLEAGRRACAGEPAWLSPADPVVRNLYTSASHHGWTRYHQAFAEASGGQRPGADTTDPATSQGVRLAPLDPERDEVRPENLEEAFRLASRPTASVRATCRDRAGGVVGFVTLSNARGTS